MSRGFGGYVLPSLRLWLQSTSLLAVLAGYSLLLLLNQTVASWQRNKAHQDLAQQLSLTRALPGSLSQPGFSLQLLPGAQQRQPELVWRSGQAWLTSVTPLLPSPEGERSLLLIQDVTLSVQRERLAFYLLIAMAGVSALLTSALLRLVLRRGLVQPLEELSEQLDALAPPPAPSRLLIEASQPQELRPIAAAFNAMQQRLAASWEHQRTFVDGVAHELRTPLTLISGHAQSLEKHASLNQIKEAASALRLIHAEAHRMGLLVGDLLDLARRDAGRLELNLRPINVDDVLFEVFERLHASSGGRLKLLNGDLGQPNSGEVLALADPDRLQQCLASLIENALRYSPDGKPVELYTEQSFDHLILHVSDYGPGVVAAESEQIFERFFRGTAADGTRGSGIGLSIVRLLMEAMMGSVAVAEAAGGGADFQLRVRSVK